MAGIMHPLGRIVLATAGSLGDLHPYIAVGRGLKARGHNVTVATVDSFRSNVEIAGLQFHRLRPDISPAALSPEALRGANDLRDGDRYLVKELVLPATGQSYEDLVDACRGADLMLSHPIVFPAPVVAEKIGIRWLSVVLSPGSLTSAWDPPIMPPLAWLHGLRHFGPLPNRLLFRFCYWATRGWMKPIDDLRRNVGLPPAVKHPIHDGMFSPLGMLGWFSEILGPRQPDWPVNTQITGFPFYDALPSQGGMDAALAHFLDAGEPPVVFTLGSAAVHDPGAFFEQSLKAVRRTGCRAVFLVGPGGAGRLQPAASDTVVISDYAPFSELFPRASAVVHQGGMGTAAQALRAGVPSLVVPFMHDQPDNAFRLRRLGVARVLSRARYNAQRAAANLNELLAVEQYAREARRIAGIIQQEDGVANACRAIEQHVTANQRIGV